MPYAEEEELKAVLCACAADLCSINQLNFYFALRATSAVMALSFLSPSGEEAKALCVGEQTHTLQDPISGIHYQHTDFNNTNVSAGQLKYVVDLRQ